MALQGSSYTPCVDPTIKPFEGMVFDDLDAAEEFYKTYAHSAGFGVRVGQHTDVKGFTRWKRWMCSREGFRSEKDKDNVESKKRKYVRKLTRCGCEAILAVKHTCGNKFRVETFVESHTHELVSPSKQQLIRSNRKVNEKAKRALITCHKGGIGTSGAYRYLRISEGGFENVGCTRRDLQNYHKELRSCIKSSDAQMFVDNLCRMNDINPSFLL